MKIGVFDSGIGGLTVLSDLNRAVNGATIYYYGDNLNAPYGNKSESEILSLVRPAFDEFLLLRVDAAVIACNTATAVCADILRAEYPYIIIGMEPAIRPALKKYGSAAVICTRATAESEKFSCLLSGAGDRVKVFCPNALAGEIERSAPDFDKINLATHFYPPFFEGYPCVVLGCTHYILLRERIEKYLSKPAADGNAGTIIHLIKQLTMLNIQTTKNKKNEIIFLGMCKKHNKLIFSALKM